THLTVGNSFWAEPSVDSLRAQMRSVYNAPAYERAEKTERARRFVLGRFTWQKVAERYWNYCRAALEQAGSSGIAVGIRSAERRLGFVTTWNTRCGIAEYSRYLATSLPSGQSFAVFANRPWEPLVRPDEAYVTRCWEPYTGVRSGAEEIEELS